MLGEASHLHPEPYSTVAEDGGQWEQGRSAKKAPVVMEGPSRGRRIYLHERSLEFLALTDESTAELVSRVDIAVRARKVFHHRITDLGVEFGLVRPRTATSLRVEFDKLVIGDFTDLLRNTGHRPRRPRERDDFYPVLGEGEHIVATCLDAGYLTFATDKQSAEVMYADTGSLKALWNAYMAGTAPADLTMIKGEVLALLDKDEERIGAGTAHLHQGLIGRTTLTRERLQDLRSTAASHLVENLESAVVNCQLEDPTADEQKALRDAVDTIARCLLVNPSVCDKPN